MISQPNRIAVLLPCYNEQLTIAAVIRAFRTALPDAQIVVYDNNSTDQTADTARNEGAEVRSEQRQGKGHVVRRMFAEIDADVYVMADGDGTYSAADAPILIDKLLSERCDMVVGTREDLKSNSGRRGHALGNYFFNVLFRLIFGREFTDIFSGYRVFTRRFAKSFPALSGGFEIETEMSVHAAILHIPTAEVSLKFGKRPEGSVSKLSTLQDGLKIFWTFLMLMKETRPFLFFSIIGTVFLVSGGLFMIPVLKEYFETGFVSRMPTWILANMLVIVALQLYMAGILLDSVARSRAEHKRIQYLSVSRDI